MPPLSSYLRKDTYTGPPFRLFSPAHLITLALFLGLAVFWFLLPPLPAPTAAAIRIGFGLLMWTLEIGWHLWNIYVGDWSIRETLPFHLCSVLVWLTGLMLITANPQLWLFSYFFGIGGGFMAILTPDAGRFDFPHYRYLHTMVSHGLLMNAPLLMIALYGFRPTFADALWVSAIAFLYMLFVFPLNFILKSNYMYLRHKPPTASIYDAMPQWPWYIPTILLVALAIVALEYAPWAIIDWLGR